MTNLSSFGNPITYGAVIELVKNNKHSWRKAARFILKVRRLMYPWSHIDRENQMKSAVEYVTQATKDYVLAPEIKRAVVAGISKEFGLDVIVTV